MYHIEWLCESRIVMTRPIGDQSSESFNDGVTRVEGYFSQGVAPVHIVADMRYMGKFPTDLSLLRKAIPTVDSVGTVVIVGGNKITRFLSTMLTQLSGKNPLEFCDTVEDALFRLQRIDQSLPNEIVYKDSLPIM